MPGSQGFTLRQPAYSAVFVPAQGIIVNRQRLQGAREEGHQATQCGGSSPCHVAPCPLDRWRSIRGNSVVGFSAGLPAGPYAGNPPLSAHSELEERAQRKTGVDTLLHCVLPLGLANERG